MNRIIQEKNKRRQDRLIQSKLKPLLIGLWFLCFCSFIYTVLTIYDVLIDYKLPLLLASFCGLIGIFFTKNKNNYCFAFFGYGSLFLGIPLFINNTFAASESEIIKLMINGKQHSAGRHGPSVDVKYKDFEKNINVDDNTEMDSSSYIVLTVKKGLLGYYVIKDHKLVKE